MTQPRDTAADSLEHSQRAISGFWEEFLRSSESPSDVELEPYFRDTLLGLRGEPRMGQEQTVTALQEAMLWYHRALTEYESIARARKTASAMSAEEFYAGLREEIQREHEKTRLAVRHESEGLRADLIAAVKASPKATVDVLSKLVLISSVTSLTVYAFSGFAIMNPWFAVLLIFL